jgi:hypothetical protein
MRFRLDWLHAIHVKFKIFNQFSFNTGYVPALLPPPQKQIRPSGIKWEYWKEQDFKTGFVHFVLL